MFNVRLYSWCVLVFIKVLLPSTNATQLIGNLNSSGKFSIVDPMIYTNLTGFNGTDVSSYPKQPHDVQIEYINDYQIKVKWKIEQESLESLKGFGLQVVCNYGLCKNVDPENFTLVPYNNTMTDFDMTLEIGPGSKGIKLTSLPFKSDCDSTVLKTVVMILQNNSGAPLKSSSPIYIFSQQNKALEMNFEAPLSNNTFKICLENGMNFSQCLPIEKPPAIFKGIANGDYNVTVTENNSLTDVIKIRIEETCNTREWEDYLYPLFGGLFIGILALLNLYLVVKINGLRWHTLEKKYILLLNTSDNPIHEEAVENFIECLKNINIIVLRPILPFSEEKLQWLLSTVDNVLLIDSLALSKRQEAWAVNKDYRQFLQEKNSRELTKYLFSLISIYHDPKKTNRFLRCKWKFVPKDSEFKNYPSGSPSFIIPGNFQLLAEMIHKSSVDMRDCKTSKSMLKQNILKEVDFVTQNPDWFSEKYGTSIHAETELENPDQSHSHPVFNTSDLISHVSSYFQKLNQHTDKEAGLNMVSLSGFEVISV